MLSQYFCNSLIPRLNLQGDVLSWSHIQTKEKGSSLLSQKNSNASAAALTLPSALGNTKSRMLRSKTAQSSLTSGASAGLCHSAKANREALLCALLIEFFPGIEFCTNFAIKKRTQPHLYIALLLSRANRSREETLVVLDALRTCNDSTRVPCMFEGETTQDALGATQGRVNNFYCLADLMLTYLLHNSKTFNRQAIKLASYGNKLR